MFIAFVPLQGWNPAKKRGDGFKAGASLIYRRTPLSATLPRNGVPTEDLRQRGTGWQLSDTTGQLRFG